MRNQTYFLLIVFLMLVKLDSSALTNSFTVQGSVQQAIHSAKELGLDVASVAVVSVIGAVNGVKQVGGDTLSATKNAITAALDASTDIGTETLDSVKASIHEGVEGAKELMEEIRR
ncbi:MAG: hypothetical protein M3Q58_11485 [Bacteroidota bacterium]|nr:hypothetical protein [Bacteroidota bacterium]